MDTIEISQYVIQGHSSVFDALAAIRNARLKQKVSGEEFLFRGKPTKVWLRGHYQSHNS